MKTIDDLIEIGFINVGYWYINVNNKLDFRINDSEHLKKSHLLYSFESNSIVKYIGITEKSLKERLNNYKSGHNNSSGSTNKKVYNSIIDTISKRFPVNILILKDEAPCTYKGYEISLATGIEKSLIREFSLKENLWNSRGTNKTIDEMLNLKNEQFNNDSISLSKNETVLKLGKEARKGWLLFKDDVDYLLPKKSTHMSIIYSENVIDGCRFTRSFSNKKINGGFKLKEIFETDFKNENTVKVSILSNNSVSIDKLNEK